MRSIIAYLPVITLTAMNGLRVIKYRKIDVGNALVITGILALVWFLLQTRLDASYTGLIMTFIMAIAAFEVFQRINSRVSPAFYILFVATIGLAGVAVFFYPKVIILNEYFIFMLYFLAESNQRFMKKTYEERASEYQNLVISRQVNEVNNIYMTMRGWRHDYHNHLQTLKAHLKMLQIEEARSYLDKLESDLDHINQLIETGNVNLDAILNSKLSLALKNQIECKYKAQVPSTLTVSDIDLCVLIGNLIDNAVEACEKIDEGEGKRFIRLYIGVLKQQLYISITNGTKEVIRKLDEEYISTKRGNHGHGLKRINNIVEKYEGYINRKNEPGVFVTEVLLPL